MSIQNLVSDYIAEKGHSHILIHSDLLFGFKVKFENQQQFLSDHMAELEGVCQGLEMVMPTFNYDFTKSGAYNVHGDESQVGILSEYFRINLASWRNQMPIFNFCGNGKRPEDGFGEVVDPFGEDSYFGILDRNKGVLMHYGSGIQFTTLIHYAERISGKLVYRYDKYFKGEVIDEEQQRHAVQLKYHVRPMSMPLSYDWEKIQFDLKANNIILGIKEKRTKIILGRIDKIVAFWCDKMEQDPFYFLDPASGDQMRQKYEQLQRPFAQNDFEK